MAGEAFTVTERFGHPDHAMPMWEISYNPLRDAEGRIIGAVQHGVDVDDQIRAKDDLAQAQEQLRQSQKLDAIGQLTGGVAHDFNNLLTVIRGSVDLLRRDNLPDAKRIRYIDAIGDTADRAAKLTGQLLAFARRQALKSEVFDAGVSLREVATMVQTMTGSRIVLDIKVPETAFYIDADRSQFDTAIVNMGINARDSMGGEGRLTIATGPVSGIPALRGHPARVGDFVAFTITDTGSGIPADVVDRIFEPFFTTKGVGEGTGLGLSQVIGFAKQSGGDISVSSVLEKGTTFTMYMPRAYPDGGEAIDMEAIEQATGEGVCVLVVEDNEQVGEFAIAALREIGFDTVLATDGHAALKLLGENCSRFHVIFSDVVMPGMGGIELGAEVRRLYPDVPIVLTSGYSHVLAQNGQHGFELLHKPYSVEQLSHVLRKAITWQARKRERISS
jgi:signal transduction histidine kinase/CheY-like chemotaxis protein